ncbi:pentapeptide repeat-containing protein [Chamaesiphon sp. VAR_48_metabat_403]|uniref:pentapeptide repeat-containing protein n=1 Tax=Chamaesiphon sp. VAR_48_metabat_403 TaxID=2964700 RepID=UPI00286D6ADA|nr:pentapeptide repeat-containing protein [Chamaesiphon sp. VAR_48_metabat_403]
MNYRLYFFCAVICFGIATPANAYSPTDLKTLLSTKKCVGCDLSGADLSRKQLVNADLQAANLVGANLTGTNLSGAKLGGANLTGATLNNTNFTQAVLQAVSAIDVNFANTNLTRTDLSYANLVNTNFRTAILANTDLAGANLALADFTGVNLGNTSLTSANLAGAKGVIRTPTQTAPITNPSSPNSIDRNRKTVPGSSPANPDVEESSTVFQRPRIYRIPPGLGRPQRLVPGGTRQSDPVNFNE